MKLLSFLMKSALIILTTIVAAFLFTDCCPPQPPSNVAIVCINEAGPEESFEADQSPEALGLSSPCAKACKNLSTLACSESKKQPGGDTCVVVCKKYGEIANYDTACVTAAKTKEAVRKCPLIKCP